MNHNLPSLPKLDECIVCDDIVRLLRDTFDGTDGPGWAQNNMEAAMCHFTEGHIPNRAAQDLGFDPSVCLGPLGIP